MASQTKDNLVTGNKSVKKNKESRERERERERDIDFGTYWTGLHSGPGSLMRRIPGRKLPGCMSICRRSLRGVQGHLRPWGPWRQWRDRWQWRQGRHGSLKKPKDQVNKRFSFICRFSPPLLKTEWIWPGRQKVGYILKITLQWSLHSMITVNFRQQRFFFDHENGLIKLTQCKRYPQSSFSWQLPFAAAYLVSALHFQFWQINSVSNPQM